jgi:hypothetical protein
MKHSLNKLSTAGGIMLFVAAVCYGVIFNSCRTPGFLTWDETDYTKAAQAGIAVNMLEQHTLSFADFLELGYLKLKKQTQDLAEYPSEFVDPFHLRHFHPPLPVYFWWFFLSDDISSQDEQLRFSNLLLQITSALMIFLFVIQAFSSSANNHKILIAGASTALFITSDIFLHAFTEMNFHSFFMVAALFFVYFLKHYLLNTSRANALLLGISSAIILCTLETSPFVFAGAILSIFLFRHKRNFLNQWKVLVLSFIAACLVLWPGIIFTLGPVKSWAMYVYRVYAMSNESYENISLVSTLLFLLKNNLLLTLFLIVGCIKIFLMIRSGEEFNKFVLIPAVVGLLYGLLILPFTLNRTYVFTAAGLMFIGSVPGVLNLFRTPVLRYGLGLFIFFQVMALFLKTDFVQLRQYAFSREQKFRSDLNEVKKIVSQQKLILADGGRIFSYYLPGHNGQIAELFRVSDNKTQFAVRKNYAYKLQDTELRNNLYSAVLIGKTRNYRQEQFEQLKQWGYKFRELNYYYLFYL